MITPREAVARAEEVARELYEGTNLRGLRLEEIARSPDDKYWDVTLGWVEPEYRTINPANLLGMWSATDIVKLPRVYKTFQIDAESGAFHEMRIRDVG